MDSICINQADDGEKAQQVPMMGDIYQKARRVVVWLGEACKNSDSAMDFAADLEVSKCLEVRTLELDFLSSSFPAAEHLSSQRSNFINR